MSYKDIPENQWESHSHDVWVGFLKQLWDEKKLGSLQNILLTLPPDSDFKNSSLTSESSSDSLLSPLISHPPPSNKKNYSYNKRVKLGSKKTTLKKKK